MASYLFARKRLDEFYQSVSWVVAAFSFGNLKISFINQWVKGYSEITDKDKYEFDKPNTPLIDDDSYKLLKVILKSICPYKYGHLFVRYKGLRQISKRWENDNPIVSKYLDFAYGDLYMKEAPEVVWDGLITVVNFYLGQASKKQIEAEIRDLAESDNLVWVRRLLIFFNDDKKVLNCDRSTEIKEILQNIWDNSCNPSPCICK